MSAKKPSSEKLHIEYRHIDSLFMYARNPRKNDSEIPRMVAAIQEFGFRLPILIKSDGSVIDGHLRIKAARQLGMTELPCVLGDGMSDAQVKAFRLLANRSVQWAQWDEELLKLEFEDLQIADFDVELTGFDMDEIAKYSGIFDVNEGEPPELRDGDRAPFQQMTFTVHDEQAEEIKDAIAKAKKEGGDESEINENTNGNAIAWICQRFNRG